MRKKALVLGSDRKSAGGVQVYTRAVEDALSSRYDVSALYLSEVGGRGGLRRMRFVSRAVVTGARERPDLVFVSHLTGLFPGIILRTLKMTHQLVCALHGSEVFSRRLARWPHLLLSRVDMYLPVSEFLAGRFIDQVRKPLRVTVLYNPLSRELKIKNPDNEVTRPIVLCISRLERDDAYKNVRGLLEAMVLVAEKRPDAELVIIGDGDEKVNLETAAVGLGLTKKVRFVPHVPHGELGPWYSRATMLALPNLDLSTSAEGFGRVFIEAAAFGVPSVGGRSGGSQEAIVDGETGLLVDAASPSEIASAIQFLLENPAARTKMSQNAREHAQRFSFEIFQRRLGDMIGVDLS